MFCCKKKWGIEASPLDNPPLLSLLPDGTSLTNDHRDNMS